MVNLFYLDNSHTTETHLDTNNWSVDNQCQYANNSYETGYRKT